jgi:hypothetical protein
MPDHDCLWIVLCESCARARGAQHDRRYTNHGRSTDVCDDCRSHAVTVNDHGGVLAAAPHHLFAIRAASAC